ncbi:hypothetical protein CDAR_379671 [Caerostris darwini]|uniref:Uncharacterized protein n=1 Tax=Caerostris darwini TaxID=1538125 RepID=A0AAV4PMT6_9ARAC|nr:hypothetical protein CDAR_379671 [Caerostris darwini]
MFDISFNVDARSSPPQARGADVLLIWALDSMIGTKGVWSPGTKKVFCTKKTSKFCSERNSLKSCCLARKNLRTSFQLRLRTSLYILLIGESAIAVKDDKILVYI